MNERILTIATNADPAIGGVKTGLWLSELTHFTDEVIKAGYEVDVASPLGGRIPLDESSARSLRKDPANAAFMDDPRLAATLESSLSVTELDPGAYDAIYLSGGHGTMFDFRQSAPLRSLIEAFVAAGKPVTAVCHGVAGLLGVKDPDGRPVVAGKRVTGFSNFEDALARSKRHMPFLLEDELKAEGGLYKKNVLPFTSRVEVDGLLITGQNPQSAKGVAQALLRELDG